MRPAQPMICIMHGYLLDGSGSNLWTRSILRAMCRQGQTVHLVCEEPHPDRYEFIAAAYAYHADGSVETLLQRETQYEGRCIMHKPVLGETLPVYVWDQYEEFEHVVPMTELSEAQLEDYLHCNVNVVTRVVRENDITVLHANHAVLMSVVAQRVSAWTGVPYVIMPHGSALEYAIKPDERLRRVAAAAFEQASRILVISDETAARTERAFAGMAGDLHAKLARLDLGVDTAAFRPIVPHERSASIAQVKELVRDLERGRSTAQGHALIEALSAGLAPHDAYAAIGDYVAKQPDEDIEDKLDSIDWQNEQVLAFIGRLIPAKGIHAVIAALPLLLQRAPRLRLLVTGHGPLREPLDAFLYAMQHGDRVLADRVLTHAESIDTGEPEHLVAIRLFWQQLADAGRLDDYWDAARRLVSPHTVVFTGYLTHREMSWLLPCCDVAIFPSMVIESGPLVFLEALASGVFPIGTYFGGMKVKIDRVAPRLEPQHARLMKVRPEAAFIVGDIAHVLPDTLPLSRRYRETLRHVADEHYDWQPIARRLIGLLADVAVAPAGTRS